MQSCDLGKAMVADCHPFVAVWKQCGAGGFGGCRRDVERRDGRGACGISGAECGAFAAFGCTGLWHGRSAGIIAVHVSGPASARARPDRPLGRVRLPCGAKQSCCHGRMRAVAGFGAGLANRSCLEGATFLPRRATGDCARLGFAPIAAIGGQKLVRMGQQGGGICAPDIAKSPPDPVNCSAGALAVRVSHAVEVLWGMYASACRRNQI